MAMIGKSVVRVVRSIVRVWSASDGEKDDEIGGLSEVSFDATVGVGAKQRVGVESCCGATDGVVEVAVGFARRSRKENEC